MSFLAPSLKGQTNIVGNLDGLQEITVFAAQEFSWDKGDINHDNVNGDFVLYVTAPHHFNLLF